MFLYRTFINGHVKNAKSIPPKKEAHTNSVEPACQRPGAACPGDMETSEFSAHWDPGTGPIRGVCLFVFTYRSRVADMF